MSDQEKEEVEAPAGEEQEAVGSGKKNYLSFLFQGTRRIESQKITGSPAS